ncbi:hypothetical protein Tco_1014330, partial [Tanacetum coccineum]
CMRTRSQARNRNHQQQQLTTVIVEEPEIPMADNRTMAQMLQAPIVLNSIENWLSSYAYESQQLDTMDDLRCDHTVDYNKEHPCLVYDEVAAENKGGKIELIDLHSNSRRA